jgi:hypothetical protein
MKDPRLVEFRGDNTYLDLRFAWCSCKRRVVLEGTFVLSEYFDVCAHSALGNLPSLHVDKKKSGTNFHCPAISWNTNPEY